jgi:predicted PurR-regulated permease PerM
MPIILATVLAYLVEPLVKLADRYTPLPRLAAIAVIYLLIIAALIAIPISALPPVIKQVNNLINNTPLYFQQAGEFLQQPMTIGAFEIPTDQLPLDQLYAGLANNVINLTQTIGGRSLSLLGSIAGATISTVGWTILVLFLSFYLVKDHDMLIETAVDLVPPSYRSDFRLLSHQVSITWNAFLRGQMVLCVVMATIIFTLALIIGLPNALILALIAGLAEFLPTIGPIIAAVPAALIGVIQSDASWLGRLLPPFWFVILILGIYGLLFQLENYYLLPRIMGYHLKLHPILVVLGALIGASVAGLLGVLLAAPVLATLRLFLYYVYYKLTDQPPFPNLALATPVVEATDAREEKEDR